MQTRVARVHARTTWKETDSRLNSPDAIYPVLARAEHLSAIKLPANRAAIVRKSVNSSSQRIFVTLIGVHCENPISV
jgi:hypothetical protein